MEPESTYTVIAPATDIQPAVEDYSEFLEERGILHVTSGYHLQVGEIKGQQGWILHLSIIRSRIPAMLDAILPLLVSSSVAFKIPTDKNTARMILDGSLGHLQVGKMVTIYPESEANAVALAAALINRTSLFQGPDILTDAHLGSIVYTRYGAFNPIVGFNADGQKIRSISAPDGSLQEDIYTIPFLLPAGITWPFGTIAPYVPPTPPKKILKGCYKIMKTLKTDAKGNVYKALRVNKWYLLGWCVIKEGRRDMWTDEKGRDILARLEWQQKLHTVFAYKLPIPKIYDYFQEDGNAYLCMQYIKGKSLYQSVFSQNRNALTWQSQPISYQTAVIDLLLKLLNNIEILHNCGYVHRDITPMNFIVHRNGTLYLIDIELAFSTADHKPFPPFVLGTKGFMSLEQELISTPSTKEDIYGLGATIINLLTGLSPLVFDVRHSQALREQLFFFLRDRSLSKSIASMLSQQPESRPDVADIYKVIKSYKQQITCHPKVVSSPTGKQVLTSEFINRALRGLTAEPTVISNGLWYSNARTGNREPGSQGSEFEKKGGLAEGITGVLYLLGKAREWGFDTHGSSLMYKKGWAYLSDTYLASLDSMASGLYHGAAGIALAFYTGLRGRMLENNEENQAIIRDCLCRPTSGLDFAAGATGQGIALLQCRDFLDETFTRRMLETYITCIMNTPCPNGSWLTDQHKGKTKPSISLSYGNTGIVWFLLEYIVHFPIPTIQDIAMKGLHALINAVNPMINRIKEKGIRHFLAGDPLILDGLNGLVITFLKASELTRDPKYLKLAEKLLNAVPPYVVHDNFNQNVGLANLGETYLEAYRLSKRRGWLDRSNWLVQVLMHTAKQNEYGDLYWVSNNQEHSTADFLTGNGGIIHFLMRSLMPEHIGYRLLTK